MNIRQTKPSELDAVMAAYAACRTFMRQQGNDLQWINGYPAKDLISADIAAGRSYVCCEGDELLAVFAFEPDADDPTYREIFDGAWPSSGPYGVIHRIGVVKPGQDVAGFCFDWCTARCGELRADTHAVNAPMKRAMCKNGFSYCGNIKTFDGTPRAAFSRPRELRISHDETRRRRLLAACIGLYALAAGLAVWLLRDVLAELWLVLLLALALLLLPGSLSLAARFGKDGGITLTPEGFTSRLPEKALHGAYPWDAFSRAAFSRDGRTIALYPRDPGAFFRTLPRKTRKALRQRRVKTDAFPLRCLLLSKADAKRLYRLCCAHIDYHSAHDSNIDNTQ